MNRSDAAAYVLPFLGALVFSASVGGAVFGGYAAVQEDLGLCGIPVIGVTPPEEIDDHFPNDSVDPSWARLDYEELTEAEKEAFQEALRKVRDDGQVRGELAHEEEFSGGALVTYEGEEYYVAIETMDECAAIPPWVLPGGVLGVLVGMGLFYSPRLSRWVRRRTGFGSGTSPERRDDR